MNSALAASCLLHALARSCLLHALATSCLLYALGAFLQPTHADHLKKRCLVYTTTSHLQFGGQNFPFKRT